MARATAQAPEIPPRGAGGGRPTRRGLLFAVMVGIAVVMLYPFYFMLEASFRTQAQFEQGRGRSLASWHLLFDTLPVGRQLLNSLLICVVSIGLILVVSTSAGFAFAKLRYRASEAIFLGVVGAMMVPLQSILIPEFVNISKIGLLDTYFGAILVYVALGTPFATFLMYTYFRGVPDELIEAGIIDGLGYGRAFLRVALPLAVPAIATVTVLQFIQIWDDLLIGLLFLQNPGQRPITVGLAALAAGRTTEIPVLLAGSFVSALPAIVAYLVFQRYLIRGLTLGIGK
jgi:ABC-type glycerol-3-phosphate transport system permease component